MIDKKATGWDREQMAERAAQDIPDGAYVNLGIGMPEKVARYVPKGREFIYHTENGLLGMGPSPDKDHISLDLINAGKKPVTAIPGAAYFHHADSFAMIRGRHIDICVLGAMQVSETGDLANWSTGAEGAIPAVGGAMDLVAGVKTIFVMTQHTTKEGQAKLLKKCHYPLTGPKVVNRIYTNLCVIEVTENGFELIELAPNVDFDYVAAHTEAELIDSRTQTLPLTTCHSDPLHHTGSQS
ncbi:3-oxoacid CoA-transferase subunit B [Shewanella surugensis]|uniref:3-oxoacid CoA-transferase subunit B n=1 Tax=Shewanella surugensis TaxID=212020 RepID=A0ABT0LAK1_9GAMM|nr:3-oxoacid CoA-transferase subunit B [Shewanella surugensis]MCL1124515.1 3-oxoacid CoA-transferase subunit B [Shewanella surugensis]